MEGMDFGTDIEAFVKAEAHIMGDEHSKACLATEGLTEDYLQNDLLQQLKGKNLETVFANDTLKGLLEDLFKAAGTCIYEGGCFSEV